jgi:RNA polymerase sigma-70 factor (ECF subfamily)
VGEQAQPVLDQHTTTDEEIVRRVRAGYTEMFEILMRRHNQRLYCAALAIVRDDAEAEEAVQHAYLAAYRHLGQFEGRARFSTWLTRIAVHEAIARRRRTMDRNGWSVHTPSIDTIASGAPDPERQAYAGELGTLLDSALGDLPTNYRDVFVLREIDGLSTSDTAAHLRLSEGTVRTRLHRAKNFLQQSLLRIVPGEACRFDGVRCDRLVEAVMRQLGEPDDVVPRPLSPTATSETRPNQPFELP